MPDAEHLSSDRPVWSGSISAKYGSQSDGGPDHLDVTKVELVACAQVTEPSFIQMCEMTTFGSSAREVQVPLYRAGIHLSVREAATGKEVRKHELEAPAGTQCPSLASAGKPVVDFPEQEAANIVILTLTAHAESKLPLDQQVAAICDGSLDRASLPAARPVDAVTMAVATKQGQFTVLGPASPVVVPRGRTFVAPELAGSVLCVRLFPHKDGTVEPEYTAITLATGKRTANQGGVERRPDGRGRTPLEATGEWGLERLLAEPRTHG